MAFSDAKPFRWPLKVPPVESEIHYLTEEEQDDTLALRMTEWLSTQRLSPNESHGVTFKSNHVQE